jgi:hypothetical protein
LGERNIRPTLVWFLFSDTEDVEVDVGDREALNTGVGRRVEESISGFRANLALRVLSSRLRLSSSHSHSWSLQAPPELLQK